MASKSKAVETVAEETPIAEVEAPKAEIKAPVIVESVYTAAELISNHKVFKTSREIVAVALRLAGKEEATFSEAKTIIEKFRHKEVK